MKVYRFERNGYGPYTLESPVRVEDNRLNEKIDQHEANLDKWPLAGRDGIPYDYAIGCPSLALLAEWFDGMIGSLVRCGFRIRVYDVHDWYTRVGYSGKQMGYDPHVFKKVIR